MENNNILQKTSKLDLIEFYEICSSLFQINRDDFINEVQLLYKWHANGDIPQRVKDIQNRWYKSLENNLPDYSVYDDIFYLADCFACWKVYSRNYLKSIVSNKSLASKDSHLNFYNLKSIVEKNDRKK